MALSSTKMAAASTSQLERAVLSTFKVFEIWDLNESEIFGILGCPIGKQIAEWRAGDLSSMTSSVVSRLRDVGEIFRLLQTQSVNSGQWLRQPQAHFANRSALDRMVSGYPGDLGTVRDYLKFHCGSKPATANRG